MISNKFKTISIIRRRIKDQYSYEDFRQEWLPEVEGQYSIPTYVINALKVQDEKEVISIGLITADLEAVIEEAKRTMNLDSKRKNKIIEVADSHGNAELYTIKNIDSLTCQSSNCRIECLTERHVPEMVDAFKKIDSFKSTSLFEGYLKEVAADERLVWVAFSQDRLAGYITLKWQSLYPSFKEQNIPEIMDLNVLSHARNMGIGSMLLDMAEKEAAKRSNIIGIGVGLYGGEDSGYGSAQRLYVKRGYIPDGKGITYNYESAIPGDDYPLDDDLVLWFTKKLK
jgi:GNAT superfamily N-acetyltransferase